MNEIHTYILLKKRVIAVVVSIAWKQEIEVINSNKPFSKTGDTWLELIGLLFMY